jgi:hypothetical protein
MPAEQETNVSQGRPRVAGVLERGQNMRRIDLLGCWPVGARRRLVHVLAETDAGQRRQGIAGVADHQLNHLSYLLSRPVVAAGGQRALWPCLTLL